MVKPEYFNVPKSCDNCDFLGTNGVCGYCMFTSNCYDGENDLEDDRRLPNCPFRKEEADTCFNWMESITQLGILLSDENGILLEALNRDWNDRYKGFSLIEAWDCFVDDVTRLEDVLNLHDKLSEVAYSDWKFLETGDPDDLDLSFKDEEWLNKLRDKVDERLEELKERGY